MCYMRWRCHNRWLDRTGMEWNWGLAEITMRSVRHQFLVPLFFCSSIFEFPVRWKKEGGGHSGPPSCVAIVSDTGIHCSGEGVTLPLCHPVSQVTHPSTFRCPPHTSPLHPSVPRDHKTDLSGTPNPLQQRRKNGTSPGLVRLVCVS